MYVVTVTFCIKPAHLESFMAAMREQARVSLEREPDCHVFDVCCDPKNSCRIFLYEGYGSEAAFSAHLASEHFRRFHARVAPWIDDKQVENWRLDRG